PLWKHYASLFTFYIEILLHYLKIAALNHGLYYSILVSSFHATSSFKYPESSNSSFMFINSSFMIYVQDRYLADLYFMTGYRRIYLPYDLSVKNINYFRALSKDLDLKEI
ncbi:hypothetical protein ACJX0J_012857, partial [Zea mays]